MFKGHQGALALMSSCVNVLECCSGKSPVLGSLFMPAGNGDMGIPLIAKLGRTVLDRTA
jgi:hypothetical protein